MEDLKGQVMNRIEHSKEEDSTKEKTGDQEYHKEANTRVTVINSDILSFMSIFQN